MSAHTQPLKFGSVGQAGLIQSIQGGTNPALLNLGFSQEQINAMSAGGIQKLLDANGPNRRKFHSRVTLKLATSKSAPTPPPVPAGP